MAIIDFFCIYDKDVNNGNDSIKGFYSSKKSYLRWGSTWRSLDQESNAYATELAWHVLFRGSLNWLLLVHCRVIKTKGMVY